MPPVVVVSYIVLQAGVGRTYQVCLMAVGEVVVGAGKILSAFEVAASVALRLVAFRGFAVGTYVAEAGHKCVMVNPTPFDRTCYFAAFLNAFHTDSVLGIFIEGEISQFEALALTVYRVGACHEMEAPAEYRRILADALYCDVFEVSHTCHMSVITHGAALVKTVVSRAALGRGYFAYKPYGYGSVYRLEAERVAVFRPGVAFVAFAVGFCVLRVIKPPAYSACVFAVPVRTGNSKHIYARICGANFVHNRIFVFVGYVNDNSVVL